MRTWYGYALAPESHLTLNSGPEAGDRWAPRKTTATSLVFTLPEAGGGWFTTSHLSLPRERNNSRQEANNWHLTSVTLLDKGDDRIRRGAEPCVGGTKRSRTPQPQDQGDPQLHIGRKTPLGQKGRGCPAKISLHSLPTMLCLGIRLAQKMRSQIRGGPRIQSAVKDKTS